MQVGGDESHKSPPHHKVEACDGDQRSWAKVHFAGTGLELSHLLEGALLQQVAEAAKPIERTGGVVERLQPIWRMEPHFAQHRFEHLRNLVKADLALVESGRRAGRKVLH